MSNEPHKLLTLAEVIPLVRLKRSAIFEKEARGEFPRGRMIAGNRKVWFAEDIREWQEALPVSRAKWIDKR
jgi:predicted DNA-binding transcriptional regulator AlpA